MQEALALGDGTNLLDQPIRRHTPPVIDANGGNSPCCSGSSGGSSAS